VAKEATFCTKKPSFEAEMIFEPMQIPGAFVVKPEAISDERGFFARSWCQREFEAHGLNTHLVQCNISQSRKRGTLRGMHYQAPPHEEAKLVRCTRGSIYDVVLDLRRGSPTFKNHDSVVLSATNHLMAYVPEGCAHGFITLEDDVEVFYQMSEFYVPDAQRGVRFDDPAFAIRWPEPVAVIAPRDAAYPDFET
jgi:dTDP-4-dehydrorhamnose 3,5-epimerase